MGRSVAYRFSVRMSVVHGFVTPAGWESKHAGRPNAANLAKYVELFNASLLPGGCNAHLGESTRCVAAELVDHCRGNAVIATWAAPAFEVLS
jgi:hypothetical protein